MSNYTIVTMVGAFMALKGWTDIGSLVSYLVFVRQTAMPINQFTLQSNFLLAALAGAENLETMEEELRRMKAVTLVNVIRAEDGPPQNARRRQGAGPGKPRMGLIPLRESDVQFKMWISAMKRASPDIENHQSLRKARDRRLLFVGATDCGEDNDYQSYPTAL